MPIYEYECSKCKSRFEIQRGFHEEGDVCCPQCGGEGRQIFLPTPIIFKGSGFYITDSRKKVDQATGEGQPAKSEPEKTEKKSDVETKAKPVAANSSPKTDSAKPLPKPELSK